MARYEVAIRSEKGGTIAMFKKISVMLSFVLFAVMVSYAAPRATDLNRLVERFDQLVTPESAQDEMTLSQELVKISAKTVEDKGLGQSIARLVLERLGSDVSLESFEMVEVAPTNKKDLDQEVLNPIFAMDQLPYFCAAFKNFKIDWDRSESSGKKCRALTRKLLADLPTAGETQYLIKVVGEAWGAYAAAFLIVQSEEDPEQFVLYDFDIVHEI